MNGTAGGDDAVQERQSWRSLCSLALQSRRCRKKCTKIELLMASQCTGAVAFAPGSRLPDGHRRPCEPFSGSVRVEGKAKYSLPIASDRGEQKN